MMPMIVFKLQASNANPDEDEDEGYLRRLTLATSDEQTGFRISRMHTRIRRFVNRDRSLQIDSPITHSGYDETGLPEREAW